MTKKHVLLLAWLFCMHGYGQTREGSSLLWEISGSDLTQPSYLFGTLHYIEKKKFFMPEALVERFQACRILMTENGGLVNRYVPPETVSKLYKRRYLLPQQRRLQEFLSAEQLDSLMAYIDRIKLPRRYYKYLFRYKPMAAGGMLSSHRNRIGASTGYEHEFFKMVAQRNKNGTASKAMIMMNLEEYKETVNILDSISVEHQVGILMKDIATDCQEYPAIVEAYMKQDIELLHRLGNDDITVQTLLLDHRNQNWIPKIEKYIRSQRTFIAVGAAHLAGKNGLIQLLKNKGYELRPIYLSTDSQAPDIDQLYLK